MIPVDACFVINLKRDVDRWRQSFDTLPEDWPLPTPQRFDAVDGRFGELHASMNGVYVPDRWLAGQAAGVSNIKEKMLPESFFPDAIDVAGSIGPSPSKAPATR